MNQKKLIKDIYLFGPVDETMSEQFVSDLNEDTDLNSITNLNIFISSQGGTLHDCMTMLDMLEYLKSKHKFIITTFGLGLVASAGFFLFLMGDKRLLFPRCRVYVHEHVCTEEMETPYSHKKEFEKEEDVLHQMYTEYCSKRLNISYEKADKFLRKDAWLNEEDITTYGIITEKLIYGKK